MGKLDAGYMETLYHLFHCSLTPVQGTQVQPHIMQQLRPRTASSEPTRSGAGAPQLEKATHHNEGSVQLKQRHK